MDEFTGDCRELCRAWLEREGQRTLELAKNEQASLQTRARAAELTSLCYLLASRVTNVEEHP